jgi:hypothetical protein
MAEPAALAAALERALAGRLDLLREGRATPPRAVALSAAHLEALLVRLEAVVQPAGPVAPPGGATA